MGDGSLCVLPLRLHRSSPHNQENVEGRHPTPPTSFKPPSLTLHAEHRLVLHLLRTQLPTIRHPPRHQSPLVPLPSPRVQSALDAALGHCRHRGPAVRRTGLDVLRDYIRWGAGLLFL